MREYVKSGELIVWIGNANSISIPKDKALEWFSAEEIAAWQSLKFDKLRCFYAAVHLAVRTNIASFFDVCPSSVAIGKKICPRCGSFRHGPPALFVGNKELSFSLSKSYPGTVKNLAHFSDSLISPPSGAATPPAESRPDSASSPTRSRPRT